MKVESVLYHMQGVYPARIGILILGLLLGPAPADSQQFLQALATHPSLAQVSYGLFSLADFLLVPAVLALYLALKRIG